jgi:riboflavin synthase
MFSGIIQAVGRIASRTDRGGDVQFEIATGSLPMENARPGDSIAVDGVCLTVLRKTAQGFLADVSRETLSLTTLGPAGRKSRVNLEHALVLGDALGGHLVSGHVDGVGRVKSRAGEARSIRFLVEAPRALARYIARKGSITVNGVSLTVNEVKGSAFSVNLVPHTLAATNLGDLKAGDGVNLEVDLVARYLERLLPDRRPAAAPRKRAPRKAKGK